MSALSLQRRQQIDLYQQHHYSTTSAPLQINNNLPLRIHSNTQYLGPIPSEAEIARLSHSPLSTTESSPATSTLDFDGRGDYYMQRLSSDTIQQDSNNIPSIETSGIKQAYWGKQQQQSRSAIGPQQQFRHSIPSGTFHRRTNSDSTIHSAPYTPTTSYTQSTYQPYIVDSESQQYSPHNESFDHHHHHHHHTQNITSIPKSYPHVSQPLDHSTIFAPDHQTAYYNNVQDQLHWNETMRQAILQRQQYHQQGYHNMEHQGDMTGSIQDKVQPFSLSSVPAFGRTISAICEDELYNVTEPMVPAPISNPDTSRINSDGQPISPSNSVFSQRLQAANQGHLDAARSASPTTSSFSRDKSPFRPTSTYSGSPYDPPTSPGPRMNTAAHMRESQRAEDAAHALANASRKPSESFQTVSPKEVTIEYEASENENQHSLFGGPTTPPRHSQHQKRPSRLNQELTRSATYENLLKREELSSVSNDSATSTGSQLQIPQHYPFIRTPKPGNSGVPESSQESNPRFPATMISMESTRSERSESQSSVGHSVEVDEDDDNDDEESDQDDDTEEADVSRPDNTRSDGGTYTCTYHGCAQRFETPQKLQRHKKEGHRQGTPSTNVDNRLTQAGPHKCERLNPQTGKPCNSIFSRPYDLTRHEDTIHNARKQKVRCVICTEEKTFSRNDALTRHMRVVHPEIEFNGKTKRGSR